MNQEIQSSPDLYRRLALSTLAVVAGAGAIAACSKEGSSDINYQGSDTESTVIADAETLQGVDTACGVELALEANSANVNFAGPDALLPSLQTVGNNQKTLFTATEASKTLKQQVATDARVLATLHANITETRKELQTPDARTIGHIGELVNTYTTNSEAAAQDATVLCDALDEVFIVPTESFGVPGGHATEFITVRNEAGEITEIQTRTVTNTSNLRGFKVSYNKDGDYNDVQRAVFDTLEDLVVITAEGTVVVLDTFGVGSVTVENFEDKTTAKPDQSTDSIPANNDGSSTTQVTTPSGAGSGNGGGGTGGGTGGGNGGGGDAPTQPSTPDAPGTPDTTGTPTDVPGTTTGNTVTPTTKPTVVTSAPPTLPPITITIPPTTPPVTAPPTTTKGEEPPADCVNNPFDPRC